MMSTKKKQSNNKKKKKNRKQKTAVPCHKGAHHPLPPTPSPLPMSVRTRCCSCCALREDTTTTTTTTTARPTRLLASRTQPVPATTTMGIAAAHFDCPSFFSYSPRTNGPVSSTCKAEECVVTLHTTRGLRTGCACSQAHTCVCEHATQLPRLHLASSTHHSSSRGPADLAALWEEAHPQCISSSTCVWRRVTGPLLSMAGTKRRGPGPSHASMGAFFLP